jgi:Putative DNA-binding domain
MSSLRDLQRQFVAVLFQELHASQVTWVRSRNDGPQLRGPRRAEITARLAMYRNNLQEGFIKALALEFPVIRRLVGEDYFRQLAGQFLGAYPSRSGDLHAIGSPFPRHLRSRFAGTEYAYLPDVAQLEWAYEEAAIAAEAPAFDVRSLVHVAPESYGGLRFNLHPACYLVSSIYPILRIWQVNQIEVENLEIVDLSTGPDHIATRRVGHGVELVRVPRAEYILLECFARGATLSEALTALQRVAPGADLGGALRQLLALGMITSLQTDDLFANKGILP